MRRCFPGMLWVLLTPSCMFHTQLPDVVESLVRGKRAAQHHSSTEHMRQHTTRAKLMRRWRPRVWGLEGHAVVSRMGMPNC
ncbi:hypothetical protein F5883DRAFT_534972 [Diaporthe sp. PMI_573]|nr:hypothetical protein F5883DRAFT_534972 [Diaporthaceae sp. PMI_573]